MPVYYTAALCIATVTITGLAAYAWWNRDVVERSVRANLRVQKEEGRLPPELQQADIDKLDVKDFNVKVPEEIEGRQSTATFLAMTWYVWVPAVFLVCIGLAALAQRLRPQ